LAADKGYDKQALRGALRELSIRPLITHRIFAPNDNAQNAKIDKQRYNQYSNSPTIYAKKRLSFRFLKADALYWRIE